MRYCADCGTALTEGAGCPTCSSNRSNGWLRCTKHPDHPASGVCSWSGKPYCREELVDIDGKQVAKDNVTKFMQDERERLSRAMPPNPPVVISTSASPGFFAQVSNRTRMITGVLAVLLATGQMVWKYLPSTFKDRVLLHDQKDQPIGHASLSSVSDASSSSPSEIAPDSIASGEPRKVPSPAAPDKSFAPVAPAPEPGTVFTVAALITAFESDKVAATKMLKGRRVTVRDVVEKFGRRDIFLRNVSTRDRSSMKCHFNQDISGLPIQAGSTITVKGALDKRGSTGTIGLNDCAVVTSDSR